MFAERVDRVERLRRAFDVARSSPVRVVAGDGVDDLARAAGTLDPDGVLCVFHSWALTYFDDREAFAAAVAGLAEGPATSGGSRSSRPARCPASTSRRRDPRLTPDMAANTVLALMHVTPDGRHRPRPGPQPPPPRLDPVAGGRFEGGKPGGFRQATAFSVGHSIRSKKARRSPPPWTSEVGAAHERGERRREEGDRVADVGRLGRPGPAARSRDRRPRSARRTTARRRSVRTMPADTAFTRTFGAHSIASVRVRLSSPALAAP